mgnify:FL=1
MRKGLLIIGAVLLVVAVILGIFTGMLIASSTRYWKFSVTLQPGERIKVGTISSSQSLTVFYVDSINESLQPYVTAGSYYAISRAGHFAVTYNPHSGIGTLYLINNYSEPVSIVALVAVTTIFTTETDLLMAITILAGLAGIILIILGAVLKPRKKQ